MLNVIHTGFNDETDPTNEQLAELMPDFICPRMQNIFKDQSKELWKN